MMVYDITHPEAVQHPAIGVLTGADRDSWAEVSRSTQASKVEIASTKTLIVAGSRTPSDLGAGEQKQFERYRRFTIRSSA